jgi:uncharacterized membrane protein
MAKAISQDKTKTITVILIVLALGVGLTVAYFLFFKRPATITVGNDKTVVETAAKTIDLKTLDTKILSLDKFQSLRDYLAPGNQFVPTHVGKDNPFLP